MIFLLSIPLALVAFILESYPRFINREYGVDIWTHLLYLKEYHKQKRIPGRIENGFLVPGDYDYPPVFIWILSKFPFKLVEKYEFLFSPFFDFIHLIIIFGIVYILTSNIFLALLTQLLYILTPIIILENSSATPRSLGYTLFTILMMSVIFYYQNPNPAFLALAVISGSIIFLTHRFTAQGFLFFAVIFDFIKQNIVFSLVFLTSFAAAVLLSKGFYIKVLRGHIGNLKFWGRNIEYRFAHQVKGNIGHHENRDFIFRIYNRFLQFPPFVLEITSPWVLFVLYVFIFEFQGNPVFSLMTLWVVISYILALLTIWVPNLRFLGEGQRYLELSAFPAAFLTSNFLVSKINSNIGLPLAVLYSIIGVLALVTIVVIQRKAIINEKLRTLTPEMKKMFAYLKSLKTKPRLLCIPHQITTNTIYHTGCPVYVNASYTTIDKISDVYPYIRKPLREIMKDHNLDMILLNQDYATISDLKIGHYKKVHEVENFVLLKL
ncbi:MAG: hypothetical protein A3C30_00570 [Candidatus Levybacteria bacterium RIFCSPHIGHO2_02_FULL_40_18]|nr:MAG: hypothetical protein A2869_03360 [Candidatus Levybacteria bacterium RIFCSPHIGHO2_01_FULL_40_58]OGH27194.1 MAG: hypothetical protein A3C30_00570 [Candidatus Levybacteria bacterium RIFCSPHIGHO2_02_FULL_40_18]OGH31053.1 MAG: hypothetical protein A3E43_04985 [Candidatus Levybacteria bacterium RIFCSPHIGHO2_12_FULL_40_31]OGH40779.1 MAG: hypothetical protein A2894_03455 [Candidatus Levybacteria bacterium RIFCSPLOWO2_01_FULL_40_64]OGH49417.1 MAG: hypothetical protein A3I54_02095 [Candidatus Lev